MLQVDRKFVELAADIVGVNLQLLHENGYANKAVGSLVALDCTVDLPSLERTVQEIVTDDDLFHEYFGDRIIVERNFDGEGWEVDYLHIARAKAILAGRTGLTTGTIITSVPFMLQPGDVRYQGGIYLQGLGCGFSGVQAPYDEPLAWTFAHLLRGNVQMGISALPEGDFFPG